MVRNKSIKWLLPATLLLSLGSQAELKVAIINAEQAILQSEEGKAKIEAIRAAVEADAVSYTHLTLPPILLV